MAFDLCRIQLGPGFIEEPLDQRGAISWHHVRREQHGIRGHLLTMDIADLDLPRQYVGNLDQPLVDRAVQQIAGWTVIRHACCLGLANALTAGALVVAMIEPTLVTRPMTSTRRSLRRGTRGELARRPAEPLTATAR